MSSEDQFVLPAGGKTDLNQYSCLHLCVEMRAWRALKFLTSTEIVTRYNIDIEVKDRFNRTYKDMLSEYLERGELLIDEVKDFLGDS